MISLLALHEWCNHSTPRGKDETGFPQDRGEDGEGDGDRLSRNALSTRLILFLIHEIVEASRIALTPDDSSTLACERQLSHWQLPIGGHRLLTMHKFIHRVYNLLKSSAHFFCDVSLGLSLLKHSSEINREISQHRLDYSGFRFVSHHLRRSRTIRLQNSSQARSLCH